RAVSDPLLAPPLSPPGPPAIASGRPVRVSVTAPLACDCEMVPLLSPTSPPAVTLPEPLTVPISYQEDVIVPVFMPARPPIDPCPLPFTLPLAEEFVMVPKLPPTRPPSSIWLVPPTVPVAWEFVTVPSGWLSPISPPTTAAKKLSSEPTPLALPLALESETCPELKPTRPPTALLCDPVA